MKTVLRMTLLVAVLAIGLSAFTVLAADTSTVSDLAGQWQGTSRFRGISYAEASQKLVAAQDVEIGFPLVRDEERESVARWQVFAVSGCQYIHPPRFTGLMHESFEKISP